MSITSLIVIIGFIISSTQGDLTIIGRCPDIKPFRGFEVEKWARGSWFQLYSDTEKLLNLLGDRKCIEREVTYDTESETLVVESYSISKAHGEPIWQSCVGEQGDKPGKFTFRVPNDLQAKFDSVDYRVIDTDYTSYSYGYGCAKDKVDNRAYISVGIGSRSKAVPQGVLKDAVKFFKSYGLNVTLVPVDNRDCRARCQNK